MLVKAAINGSRTRAEYPAAPLMPDEQAAEARGAVLAGTGAIQVHARDTSGGESLAPDDVPATLDAIRAKCPAIPVRVSTGAWIVPDIAQRLALVRTWHVLPDFASVHRHEEGATQIIRLSSTRGSAWRPDS